MYLIQHPVPTPPGCSSQGAGSLLLSVPPTAAIHPHQALLKHPQAFCASPIHTGRGLWDEEGVKAAPSSL